MRYLQFPFLRGVIIFVLMGMKLLALIDCYCNLILSAEEDSDFNPQWLGYYRVCMTDWIVRNKGVCSNIEEARETYSRIKQEWESQNRLSEMTRKKPSDGLSVSKRHNCTSE